jgi:hypothetical protein
VRNRIGAPQAKSSNATGRRLQPNSRHRARTSPPTTCGATFSRRQQRHPAKPRIRAQGRGNRAHDVDRGGWAKNKKQSSWNCLWSGAVVKERNPGSVYAPTLMNSAMQQASLPLPIAMHQIKQAIRDDYKGERCEKVVAMIPQ